MTWPSRLDQFIDQSARHRGRYTPRGKAVAQRSSRLTAGWRTSVRIRPALPPLLRLRTSGSAVPSTSPAGDVALPDPAEVDTCLRVLAAARTTDPAAPHWRAVHEAVAQAYRAAK